MKKVLAWVLALALVLSTFAMSFATYTDDAAVKASNCEEAVSVLSALGVITGYDDGSFKPLNKVTRAEMAALIIREMGFSDVQKTGYENDFVDVAKNSWAAGVIQKAAELGLMKGYPDGTFKPAQNVTYNEALTMIVRALGYKDEDLIGSWPQNYVNQARTLDLAKGVSVTERNFQEPATRGDCAIMLYNALELPMVSSQATNLPVDDTFLARLADLLGKDVELDVKMIVQMCDIADSAVLGEELLGAPITAMTFDGVVAAVQHVDATCFDVEDIDGGVVTIDGKDYKSGNVEPNAPAPELEIVKGYAGGYAFYNGYALATAKGPAGNEQRALLNGVLPEKVWADVDGNYIDVVTEIYWDAEDTFQWDEDDSIQLERENYSIVFDGAFIKDKNDEIWTDHYFLKGVDSLDKIAEGNIVTVYETEPTYIIKARNGYRDDYSRHSEGEVISKIEVGTKTVEGTVEERSTRNNTVKIDGTDYPVAVDPYRARDLGKLAGSEGTFYLNYRGEIAAFDSVAAAPSNYAIYLDGKPEFEFSYVSGPTKKDIFKLFTATGEEAWFPVLENAITGTEDPRGFVDGGDEDNADQLVKYDLDAEGSIESIDFAGLWIIGDTPIVDDSITASEVQRGPDKKLPISDDVVVFSRDAHINGNWTVTDYSELQGKTLKGWENNKPQTEYFVEDGQVVAIACNYCLADEAGQYLFIDFANEKTDLHVTSASGAHAVVCFVGVDGEFKTVELSEGDFRPVNGLAYVTFESNGEIKSIKPAQYKNGRFGRELTPPNVYGEDVNYGKLVFHDYNGFVFAQGQEYIVSHGKNNPVTGAKYYEVKADGTVSVFEGKLASTDDVAFIQTTSEATQYDIVLVKKNVSL